MQVRVVLSRDKVTVGRLWEKGRGAEAGCAKVAWYVAAGMALAGRKHAALQLPLSQRFLRMKAGACRACTGALYRLFCSDAFLPVHTGFRVSSALVVPHTSARLPRPPTPSHTLPPHSCAATRAEPGDGGRAAHALGHLRAQPPREEVQAGLSPP